MDRKKSLKPRIRRPAKLEGEHAFLHVRVAIGDKRDFIDYCRQRQVGASQVVREAMLTIISGQWTPPSLKPRRKR